MLTRDQVVFLGKCIGIDQIGQRIEDILADGFIINSKTGQMAAALHQVEIIEFL